MQFVFLPTDCVLWLMLVLLAGYTRYVLITPELRAKWRRVFAGRTATACAALLAVFLAIALADSVHWRPALDNGAGADTKTVSLLDTAVGAHIAGRERSYSAPFALVEWDKTTQIVDGKPVRDFARLTGAGIDVEPRQHLVSVMRGFMRAGAAGLVIMVGIWVILAALTAARRRIRFSEGFAHVTSMENPWRPAITVWMATLFLAMILGCVWPSWHPLGTDATGNDVLFSALKSVRTAVVIGSLSTLSTLPFAITLGIAAGYFKGWVDDVIQYIYTTISSIPSVLLIAASVLLIEVFIDRNPGLYETSLERADIRLLCLAVIIGVTSWAGLARLLRAETLKVSALDFVTAARSFGVHPFTVMARHIFPNVAHIVLIVAVLDFSGIVLYEAVLSYVGVGVDPVMESFGTMINAAVSEMSRTPMIWWNLLASFIVMFLLVLSANLFASGVRSAFDPKSADEKAA